MGCIVRRPDFPWLTLLHLWEPPKQFNTFRDLNDTRSLGPPVKKSCMFLLGKRATASPTTQNFELAAIFRDNAFWLSFSGDTMSQSQTHVVKIITACARAARKAPSKVIPRDDARFILQMDLSETGVRSRFRRGFSTRDTLLWKFSS